jgi:hypothetical protein
LKIFQNYQDQNSENNIKFRRRVGQRSRKPRPNGYWASQRRRQFFFNWKRQRIYRIPVPPQRRHCGRPQQKQRSEETKTREEADNRIKNLTGEDKENNLKWLVVGKKGEK